MLDSLSARYEALSAKTRSIIRYVIITFICLILISSIVDEGGDSPTALNIVLSPVTGTINFVANLDERVKDVLNSSWNWVLSLWRFCAFILERILLIFKALAVFVVQCLTSPIELLRGFGPFVRRLMAAFAQIVAAFRDLFRALYEAFLAGAAIVLRVLSRVLHFPLVFMSKFGIFLRGMSESLLRTTKAVSKAVAEWIKVVVHGLSHFSMETLSEVVKAPVRFVIWLSKALWRLVPRPYWLIQVVKAVFRIPLIMVRGLIDLFNMMISAMMRGFVVIGNGMQAVARGFVRLLDMSLAVKQVAMAIANVLKWSWHVLMWILKKVFWLPLQFILLFKNSFQQIWDHIVRAFLALKSGLVALFVHTMATLKWLVEILVYPLKHIQIPVIEINIDIKSIAEAVKTLCGLPFHLFRWTSRVGEVVARGIFRLFMKLSHGLRRILIGVFHLVRSFSLRKLIHWLTSPIWFIKGVLEDLATIPFAGFFIRVIMMIIYTPLWLVSFAFRMVWFIISSFMEFIQTQMAFANIVDMWDNVCWPQNAEYCKQLLRDRQSATTR